MLKKLCLILLLGFILPVFADRIDDLLKTVPSLETYPDASAINVLTEIKLNVNPDFSYEKHTFYLKKILTYEGKIRYSDVKIDYNSEYEKIKLGNCYTIDKDGQRIEIPENQVTDLNDQESIMSPGYIHTRQTIINFPKIEPGCFIVLDYTIINTRKEPVSGVEHFQETNPYLEKSLTISAPANLTYLSEYNLKGGIVKTVEPNITKWTIKNSPLIKEENNKPSFLICGNPVVYSFYKNWQDLSTRKLGKINQAVVDTDLAALVKEIIKNATTEEAKLLAIYEYMAKNFNQKSSYTSQIDFTPEPISVILNKKYGSAREFAYLYISLAKAAGVKEIYPALILNSNERFSSYQKTIAVDEFLNEVVVYWNKNLILPGCSHAPFKFAGVLDANILIGKAKPVLESYHYNHNFINARNFDYSLNENHATVKIESILDGDANQEMRNNFQDEPVERRKIWFAQEVGSKSTILTDGPNFDSFDKINSKLKVNYTQQISNLVVTQRPYKYFILPSFALPEVDLDNRTIPYLCKENTRKDKFTLQLEKPMQLLNNVKNYKKEFKLGKQKAMFTQNSTIKDNKIEIERQIMIPEMIVPVKDYTSFKKFLETINNPVNKMVFLQ